MAPIVLIEVLVIGGLAVAFGAWELWQLRDKPPPGGPEQR